MGILANPIEIYLFIYLNSQVPWPQQQLTFSGFRFWIHGNLLKKTNKKNNKFTFHLGSATKQIGVGHTFALSNHLSIWTHVYCICLYLVKTQWANDFLILLVWRSSNCAVLRVPALHKRKENCCSLESSSGQEQQTRSRSELCTFTGNGRLLFLWHSAIRVNLQKVKLLLKVETEMSEDEK